MAESPPIVAFDAVAKRFGDVAAVDGVSFTVREGEFFSLLGPSGCGKTTTLRLLAGFETPDAGEIRILGERMNARRPYDRPLAMVFQNYALFPHLSVARNVAFGLEQRRVPRAEIGRRVDEALALVRLDPATFARRLPAELSGGQRQRVALARALVLRPRLLLLDEPLGALDLQLRKQMQLELKRLNAETGATFVYVTHDQEEALAMSDRIAVMAQARIAQLGTPAEVYERPRTAFVATFIGEANLIGGRSVRDGGAWRLAHPTGARLAVPPHPRLADGAEVRIAVRPEWHDLWRPGEAPAGENVLPATVTEVIYLGETIHVLAAAGDGSVLRVALRNEGQLARPMPWRRGDPCLVGWLPDDGEVLEG